MSPTNRQLLETLPITPEMEEDSMSADFKVLKAFNRARIDRNYDDFKANQTAFEALPNWKRHTEHHYSFMLNGARVDYWPSRNKWRYKHRTNTGAGKDLLNFVKNRQDKQT